MIEERDWPEEISNRILRHLVERSQRFRNLPGSSGADRIAESAWGLGIPLSPFQKIILGLLSACDYRSGNNLFTLRGDSTKHFRSLIGLNNGPKRIWLPPDAEIIENADEISIGFHNPITLLLCIAGRRSGKTTIASILMASLARRLLYDPSFLEGVPILENSGISMINVACDAFQARILFRMLIGNLIKLGMLPEKSSPAERVQLGRLIIESLSSSSRSSRGRTACGICFDEFAHFQRTNGPLSDRAVWTALTPSLATFGNKSRAVIATSPAGKSGVVWDLFEQRGDRPGMLTIQAPTWVMNPHITKEQLVTEFSRDENFARQEYGAEFLDPQGRFLNCEDIQKCVQFHSQTEHKFSEYRIHVDLGLKHDATAIAIGRLDRQDEGQWRIVIEHVEIMQAGSGESLKASEIEGRILRMAEGKKIDGITFDQHQSAYLIERLRSRGYDAYEFPATSKSNQQVFSYLRDLITSGRIALTDNGRLIDELRSLECTITHSGFKVEAPYGCSDDAADAVACCAWELGRSMAGESGWKDLFSEIGRE